MNIFLDTCALFKLYHEEVYSSELTEFLDAQDGGNALIISRLAGVEFTSTVWKSIRRTESALTKEQGLELLMLFDNDYLDNFFIVDVEREDYDAARRVLNKCNAAGYKLRTLDALQLSAVLKLEDDIDLFITFDDELCVVAERMYSLSVKKFGIDEGVFD